MLEAAFAVILIVGATLLARSFVRLMAVDPGYTAAGVLIATVELPGRAGEVRVDRLIDGTLERLRAMPGVITAGAGAMIPLMRQTAMTSFAVPAAASGGKPAHGRALVYWVTSGYAEALGLRLREGRFFEADDRRAGMLRTIVNEEFVRQHLAPAPPTGLLLPGLVQAQGNPTAEIIGVVGDVLKTVSIGSRSPRSTSSTDMTTAASRRAPTEAARVTLSGSTAAMTASLSVVRNSVRTSATNAAGSPAVRMTKVHPLRNSHPVRTRTYAAHLVAHVEACRASEVHYDDRVRPALSHFPWELLRRRVAEKLDERGIRFVHSDAARSVPSGRDGEHAA